MGGIAGLILLVLVGTWYLARRWKPLVEAKLQQAVASGSVATASRPKTLYERIAPVARALKTGHIAVTNGILNVQHTAGATRLADTDRG